MLNRFVYTKFEEYLSESLLQSDNKIKEYEKFIIDAVISFFKDKFNFDADIIVRKKSNDKFFGDVSLDNNSIKKHKFTLHFNPNQSYKRIIKSLFHEMTHVKQIVKGDLSATENYDAILWKSNKPLLLKDYKKFLRDYKKYIKLPWEVDANNNENNDELFKELINSKFWKNLYGKNDTLDYILKNI